VVGAGAGAAAEEEVLSSCTLPGVSAVFSGVLVELAGGTRVIVTPLIEVVVLCGAEPLVLGVEAVVFVETLFGL
jgi:hypothetical protein